MHVSFPLLGLEMTIDRVAFTLFSIPIYWYGIIIALGFAAGLTCAAFVAKKLALCADKYSQEHLKSIIYAFDDYDQKTKNGDMDFEIGLKKIICML